MTVGATIGYDNGANMKGQNQGVQAHICCLNPRAYLMPCGCHNLNLTLGDMAKSKSNHLKCWEILNASLTVKPLTETRWESQVEYVKAIRYQTRDINDALLEVTEDNPSDPKIKSEAKSLANKIKTLKSRDMQLNVALSQLNGLIDFMQKYKDNGFVSAKATATEIASDMDIEPVIKATQRVKCKRDENQN
ncbi:hypothetical protein N1851_009200 [Merluccius polli]|uniref:Zinc finger MYM-type 1-like n=1 Tax=Merluccius polli TaxID=89951 RepID=A0AA47N1M3_MERPO|nr:hypothetical protein N1851_009200 [Merluccius polli]